ncbi:hypothetical protein EVAR_10431_1 [Eumeta japonica]|uniref:Uncharacterized protein n=1 Tax=Eumeta variegata TaxID=151549 RepID=A0A4C1UE45_EUMVA|nr:hypothetical protein EVAR_10431_1 [Eumeta japonica]
MKIIALHRIREYVSGRMRTRHNTDHALCNCALASIGDVQTNGVARVTSSLLRLRATRFRSQQRTLVVSPCPPICLSVRGLPQRFLEIEKCDLVWFYCQLPCGIHAMGKEEEANTLEDELITSKKLEVLLGSEKLETEKNGSS